MHLFWSSSPLFGWTRASSQKHNLLIIQCDSGHINGDLIAYARYRIDDIRTKALLSRSSGSHVAYVVFVIHLPVKVAHSTFVGFKGDPWVSCHIDELRPSDKKVITFGVIKGVTISQLFYSELKHTILKRISNHTSSYTFEAQTSVGSRMEQAMEEGHSFSVEQGSDEEKVMEEAIEEGTENSIDIGTEEKMEDSSQFPAAEAEILAGVAQRVGQRVAVGIHGCYRVTDRAADDRVLGQAAHA